MTLILNIFEIREYEYLVRKMDGTKKMSRMMDDDMCAHTISMLDVDLRLLFDGEMSLSEFYAQYIFISPLTVNFANVLNTLIKDIICEDEPYSKRIFYWYEFGKNQCKCVIHSNWHVYFVKILTMTQADL